MSGASIETTPELWASSLRDVKALMRPPFVTCEWLRRRTISWTGCWTRSVASWMRAEAAGDPGPWRRKAVLGRSRWDTEALVAMCATMSWRTWPTRTRCW